MQAPEKIEVVANKLRIKWKDGKIHDYDFKFLRDESPDAGNKGETILWKHIPPPPKGPDKPGKYEIKNIELVGSYAINILWGDGESYGIYSWDLLRQWGEFFDLKNNLKNESE